MACAAVCPCSEAAAPAEASPAKNSRKGSQSPGPCNITILKPADPEADPEADPAADAPGGASRLAAHCAHSSAAARRGRRARSGRPLGFHRVCFSPFARTMHPRPLRGGVLPPCRFVKSHAVDYFTDDLVCVMRTTFRIPLCELHCS